MSGILILIPARFGSSRFPGKPLAKINNKSMISYVVENCQSTGFDYAVVTDNDEIEAEVKNIGGNVVRVDDEVSTGSERIALALSKYFTDKAYDYIINVQGDEPLLDSQSIKSLGEFHQSHQDFDICTVVKERSFLEKDFTNPNVVKAAYSTESKECLYFSRSSMPYNRDEQEGRWHQHIGIYSYKKEALLNFVKLSPSRLEDLEKLEQLRALENKMKIGAMPSQLNLIGVDTPEDIVKIEGVIGGQEK